MFDPHITKADIAPSFGGTALVLVVGLDPQIAPNTSTAAVWTDGSCFNAVTCTQRMYDSPHADIPGR